MVDLRRKFIISCAILVLCLVILALFRDTSIPNNINKYEGINPYYENPLPALGESPFDTENLFKESEFNSGNFWNFTSSDNVSSRLNSIENCATINHTSPAPDPVYREINFAILDEYGEGSRDVTNDVKWKDGNKVKVYRNDYLDVQFSEMLYNGDIITLFMLGTWDEATITIYDEHSKDTPPGGYGQAYYPGDNSDMTINITLSGLDAPKDTFGIDFSMDHWNNYIYVDLVACYKIAKLLDEKTCVNQTVSIDNMQNVSYTMNFSSSIPDFENISYCILSVEINSSEIWSKLFDSSSIFTEYSIEVSDYIKRGGDFLFSFEIELYIDAVLACNFTLNIDDAYLWKHPIKNLIKNSELDTNDYWEDGSSGVYFQSNYDPDEENYQFHSYQSGVLESGWTELNQTFYKNCSNLDYQLVLDYLISNITGVKSLNLEIFFNDTLIHNETNLGVSFNWKELRLNVSQYLQLDDYYEINLRFNVAANDTKDLLNWSANIDNIFIFPLWESQISVIKDVPEEVLVGEDVEIKLYYNTSVTGDSIKGAEITVRDNLTQNEWGEDFSQNKQYLVDDLDNGNYVLALSTINASVKVYNISITVIKPNFPDTTIFRQLNITGQEFSYTIVEGAYFNTTYNTWVIYANNTPYVNDTTKFIKIYLQDKISHDPLTDGFIEANLDKNSLSWSEIFKTSKNLEDRGYYYIYLNTEGLNPVDELLEMNVSITVWVSSYTPSSFKVSTLINKIPTSLEISDIEPFYEGSTFLVSAVFYDVFHDISINDGTISWTIVEVSGLNGVLDFIFQGFYQKEIDLGSLEPGIYTIKCIASKENHELSIDLANIQIIPKWTAVAIITDSPENLFEDNYFSISYNFSIEENNTPLVNEPVKFNVSYWNSNETESFTLLTDEFGEINLNNLYAPLEETSISVKATYSGNSEIKAVSITINLSVIPKDELTITLLTTDFPAEIIGGSEIEIMAKAIFTKNGTIATNIPLEFQIDSYRKVAFTNESGIAVSTLKIPNSGVFQLNITYWGSNCIKTVSITPKSILVVPPDEIIFRNVLTFSVYLIILAAISIAAYIVVRKTVLLPRTRKRKAEYLKIMNQFEDVRNIQLIIVIDKKGGFDLFSKQLSEIPVHPTLISGFVQALSAFGQDMKISPKKEKKMLQELSFQHFIFVFEEGEYIRSALLLLKSPSQPIKDSLSEFTRELESKFAEKLKVFDGEVLNGKILDDLVERHFEISLSYIYRLNTDNYYNHDYNKWEKIIIKQLQESENGIYLDKFIEDYAYVFYNGRELELLKAILNLKKKGILKPVISEFEDIS